MESRLWHVFPPSQSFDSCVIFIYYSSVEVKEKSAVQETLAFLLERNVQLPFASLSYIVSMRKGKASCQHICRNDV